MANEIIGYMPCTGAGCDQRAAIMQATRKGAHLYTRCTDCGLDQRTGKRVQLAIWRAATWKGEPPTPPANIEGELVAGEKPKPKPTAIEPDWSPEQETAKPAAAQEAEPNRKPGAGVFLAGAGLVAGLGLIIRSAI
ncbi:hypothetical protein D8911_14580 (plasmid) [Levilactobacillus brevis]|nr:hypothetical protein D8911_14580 [Levilactobacillus brevis]